MSTNDRDATPAVNFFADNFLTGTMFMSWEQRGRYIYALCAQQLHGHLTMEQLNQFAAGDQAILEKFIPDENGLYYNERMDKEVKKRKNFCNSRAESRRGGKSNPDGAVELQLDSENPLTCDEQVGDVRGDVRQTCENHTSPRMGNGNGNGNNTTPNDEINPEYRSCSELLKARILEHRKPKITDATLTQWDREVRLMIKRDNRTIGDIKTLINECHDMEPDRTGFTWRNNILSMATLRERWNEGKIAIGMTMERRYAGTGKGGLQRSDRASNGESHKQGGATAKPGEFDEGTVGLDVGDTRPRKGPPVFRGRGP